MSCQQFDDLFVGARRVGSARGHVVDRGDDDLRGLVEEPLDERAGRDHLDAVRASATLTKSPRLSVTIAAASACSATAATCRSLGWLSSVSTSSAGTATAASGNARRIAPSVTREASRIDVRVVGRDVASHLVEDRVTPARLERVKRGEGQQQITKRRRVQDARVEDDDHRYGTPT
jgi:hypothetical protein